MIFQFKLTTLKSNSNGAYKRETCALNKCIWCNHEHVCETNSFMDKVLNQQIVAG